MKKQRKPKAVYAVLDNRNECWVCETSKTIAQSCVNEYERTWPDNAPFIIEKYVREVKRRKK